jgi:hydroxybutyrate-dimer hydrolase
MKRLSLRFLAPAGLAVVLAGCASVPMTSAIDSTDRGFGPIRQSLHRGGDDLLTAGLGIEGLRAMTPPAVENPLAPTPAELRRRAIWSNWRGIADLRPGGGAGESLPVVPGREFSALARLDGASQPHRVLLQLPDGFDPAHPCLVVAPASGSRGVYGAIAVAGPWALPRGCAVAYTDKAAGTDYFDLDAGVGVRLDGTTGTDGDLAFTPEKGAATAHSIAFKHAHSMDNPEADWGRHVRQAARFGLDVLAEQFPGHRLDASRVRVIAVGISNGGGAVLRAAEVEDDLIDAVVAGEPNVYARAEGARPLYDYATLAAVLMPCALLAIEDWPQPPNPDALRAAGAARCKTYADNDMLPRGDLDTQAREALAWLRRYGFDDHALRSGAISAGFDLWRAVAATYASAYGRHAPGEHPCGFSWAPVGPDGAPRAASVEARALWWSDGSGIPPGNGIALIDPNRAGDDPDFPGIGCLSLLWRDHVANERVAAGVEATRAAPPRVGLPVIVVHGRDDGLIPVAFSSRPYARMARDAGREVTLWIVPRAQHFDAFLAFPDYGRRFVPLLPSVHAALDAVMAHLDNPTVPLPAHSPR